MEKYISLSEKESKEIAGKFASTLKGGEIICYTGEVGAGKTMFTQGMCKELGVTSYVNSPSYIILNEYKGQKFNVFHYDLYRIGSTYELTEIGFYDFSGKQENITIVEWSEMLEDEKPEERIEINIKILSVEKREITIKRIYS